MSEAFSQRSQSAQSAGATPGAKPSPVPSPVPSTVILASAGTGKTYQLTGRFIRLLAMGVRPGAILATTFTRKAAGEILGRVLTRLASAAMDADECRALAKAIEHPLDAPHAARLLRAVVEELPRIAVLTIDAFFARLVSAYALELNLPPGWRIGDAVELSDVVDAALLRCLDEMPDVERARLLSELHEGGYGREIVPTLARVRSEATAAWRESRGDLALWSRITPEHPPLEPAAYEALTESLASMPLAQTKSGAENAHWVSAREKLLRSAISCDWPSILSNGFLNAVWSGAYFRAPLSATVSSVLEALGRHASAILISRLAMRNRAYCRAAGEIDRAVAEEKQRRGVVEFDDLPRRLLERPFEGDLDHLYYRLDARLEHVLLDEFQDTSADQFSLLKPLLEEILSDQEAAASGLTRSVFVVGDVKQSLYQWRGASPEILGTLADTLPGLGTPRTLSESWRSSAVVLDTVNRALSNVASNPALRDKDAPPDGGPGAEAGRRWDARFPEHIARKKLRGEATLSVAASNDEADLVAAAVARARAVRDRSADATIAVLVRRRKLIPWLVRDLLALGLDASQEGGNPLTDTPAVSAFVSMLHLADQPADTAAWLHVSSTPWAHALGVFQGVYSAGANDAQRASLAVREGLAREGAAGLLSRLLRSCADQTDAESLRRLEQLSQLLDRAEATGPRSAKELVRFIRETPVEAPSAARVRVMTIHQSKGLEFDAVILPELHMPWKVGRGPMVLRSSGNGPVSAVSLPGNENVRAWHTGLTLMHDAERTREYGSELCVLYVALTRAKHALEMIIPADGKSGEGDSTSAARLLRSSLAPGQTAAPGAMLWRHEDSDPRWTDEVEAPERAGQSPIEVSPAVVPPAGARRSPAAVAPPPSSHERSDGPDPVLPAASRRRGTAGHRLMELVEWLDGPGPDESRARATLEALGIDDPERAGMIALWRGWLADGQVRDSLSADACRARLAALAGSPVSLSLRREWMFATADRDGRIIRGQMDRIVIARGPDGAVSAAEILDYKTDPAPAQTDDDSYRRWLEGRIETYRAQMDAYRRSASRVMRLSPERIAVRLLMLGARPGERAVDV